MTDFLLELLDKVHYRDGAVSLCRLGNCLVHLIGVRQEDRVLCGGLGSDIREFLLCRN